MADGSKPAFQGTRPAVSATHCASLTFRPLGHEGLTQASDTCERVCLPFPS